MTLTNGETINVVHLVHVASYDVGTAGPLEMFVIGLKRPTQYQVLSHDTLKSIPSAEFQA